MRASKGGLTHEQIMRLSWRQYLVYLDSFTWLLREESEDGRQKNAKADMHAQAADPRVREHKRKMLEQDKAEMKALMERRAKGKGVRKEQTII